MTILTLHTFSTGHHIRILSFIITLRALVLVTVLTSLSDFILESFPEQVHARLQHKFQVDIEIVDVCIRSIILNVVNTYVELPSILILELISFLLDCIQNSIIAESIELGSNFLVLAFDLM